MSRLFDPENRKEIKPAKDDGTKKARSCIMGLLAFFIVVHFIFRIIFG